MLKALGNWFDAIVLDLGRQLRLSYLPPLMVYLAAESSGLTAVVGTFFIKDRGCRRRALHLVAMGDGDRQARHLARFI
jgi:hypothetical protein